MVCNRGEVRGRVGKQRGGRVGREEEEVGRKGNEEKWGKAGED